MSKRLIAFAPAALAVGVVLLTACGQADNGAQAGTTVTTSKSTPVHTGKPAKTDGVVADGSGEPVESVDCGTVEIHSYEQMLIADGTPQGRVGCTEAFNVIGQYLDAEGTPEDWACAGNNDNGYQAVSCANADSLTFHTEAAASETPPADEDPVESVDCGTVEIHSYEEVLVADGTADGRVGCTEAFNVIGQYLDAEGVPEGWNCEGTDDEYQAVICENVDGRAFHTEAR